MAAVYFVDGKIKGLQVAAPCTAVIQVNGFWSHCHPDDVTNTDQIEPVGQPIK